MLGMKNKMKLSKKLLVKLSMLLGQILRELKKMSDIEFQMLINAKSVMQLMTK